MKWDYSMISSLPQGREGGYIRRRAVKIPVNVGLADF